MLRVSVVSVSVGAFVAVIVAVSRLKLPNVTSQRSEVVILFRNGCALDVNFFL